MALKRSQHSAGKPKGVRWGKLYELDGRARIGSAIYQSYPRRLQNLHSWRRAHKIVGGHMPVRMAGTRAGIRPSSNLPLKAKEKFCQDRGG